MAETDPNVGRDLDGFLLEKRIGVGATGLVYRAKRGQQHYAVKVLADDYGRIPTLRARFEGEARALGRVDHPHIVHIESWGRVGDTLYLAMELLEGENLQVRLERAPLEAEEVLRWMDQLLDALGHAHQQHIVHRDLKPANLFLTTDGDLKILDFGLAKVLTQAEQEEVFDVTRRGKIVGTPAYMAPEQITGLSLDPRSDVYAIGVLLFELIADRRPFEHTTRARLLRAHLNEPVPAIFEASGGCVVDPKLEEVVRRALAKDPIERYPNASALREALAVFEPEAISHAGHTRSWKGSAISSVSLGSGERTMAAPGEAPGAFAVWAVSFVGVILLLAIAYHAIEGVSP